jgi:hypothetical protein
MDETGVFANVESVVGHKGAVGEQGNKEDGVQDDSQCGESVDVMLIKVSSYVRAMSEGGRRRNEGFGRRGLNTNRRRRSNRKRRVVLRDGRGGASEGKRRGDDRRRDDVWDRSKVRGSGRRNVGLDNQLRENMFRTGRHFEE